MSMDDETDSRYTTGDIAKLTGVSVRQTHWCECANRAVLRRQRSVDSQ